MNPDALKALVMALLITNLVAWIVVVAWERNRREAWKAAEDEMNARFDAERRADGAEIARFKLEAKLADAERRARRREAAKREPSTPIENFPPSIPVGAGSPGAENAT